jgi:hypothetical protein
MSAKLPDNLSCGVRIGVKKWEKHADFRHKVVDLLFLIDSRGIVAAGQDLRRSSSSDGVIPAPILPRCYGPYITTHTCECVGDQYQVSGA